MRKKGKDSQRTSRSLTVHTNRTLPYDTFMVTTQPPIPTQLTSIHHQTSLHHQFQCLPTTNNHVLQEQNANPLYLLSSMATGDYRLVIDDHQFSGGGELEMERVSGSFGVLSRVGLVECPSWVLGVLSCGLLIYFPATGGKDEAEDGNRWTRHTSWLVGSLATGHPLDHLGNRNPLPHPSRTPTHHPPNEPNSRSRHRAAHYSSDRFLSHGRRRTFTTPVSGLFDLGKSEESSLRLGGRWSGWIMFAWVRLNFNIFNYQTLLGGPKGRRRRCKHW